MTSCRRNDGDSVEKVTEEDISPFRRMKAEGGECA